MAKKSKIVANEKRRALVERYRERRDALRAATKESSLSPEEREAAMRALARLPARLLPRPAAEPGSGGRQTPRLPRQSRSLPGQLPQRRTPRRASGDHEVELVRGTCGTSQRYVLDDRTPRRRIGHRSGYLMRARIREAASTVNTTANATSAPNANQSGTAQSPTCRVTP